MSETWDERLVRVLADQQRSGLTALWSLATLFLVPGFLLHSGGLLLVGVPLTVAALSGSLARCSRPRRIAPAPAPVHRPPDHALVRPVPSRSAQECRRPVAGGARRPGAARSRR